MTTSHTTAENTYILFHAKGTGSVLPLLYVRSLDILYNNRKTKNLLDATSWRTPWSCRTWIRNSSKKTRHSRTRSPSRRKPIGTVSYSDHPRGSCHDGDGSHRTLWEPKQISLVFFLVFAHQILVIYMVPRHHGASPTSQLNRKQHSTDGSSSYQPTSTL